MHSHRSRNSYRDTFLRQDGAGGVKETQFTLSLHAQMRMDSRRVSVEAIKIVLTHGRRAWAKRAQIFAVGEREIRSALQRGLDLRPYAGLQVVCTVDRTVMTVYRNHNFKSLKRGQ